VNCTVIVPTLRRPQQLLQCLEGLAVQTRKPLETIVVRRQSDRETAVLLEGVLPLPVTEVVVAGGGQTGALAAGAAAAHGDIVAITDDDAVPRPHWIEGLLRMYQEPDVGGAGGRDEVCGNSDPATTDVGRIIGWSGKLVGNHHRGAGGVREVAVLKGVNCSYRRVALELPVNLRGTGAQVAWEWATAFRVRSRGWRLLYDPNVLVDHYPGPRFDADQRARPSARAVADVAWNEAFILGSFDRGLLYRRLAYGTLVGTSSAPGLVRAAKATLEPAERAGVIGRWWPSMRGMYGAAWSVARGDRVECVVAGDLA